MLQICKREWRWLNEVPYIPKFNESKGRTRFLTPDEAKKILAKLDGDSDKDVRLACMISLTYGSRLGETCALKWHDVDLDNRIIVFQETKNGMAKGLPIPDRLWSELQVWKDTGPSSSESY